MLDRKTLNNFISKVNGAYQQFCVWLYSNNQFAKYQNEWNKIFFDKYCKTEKLALYKSCKYKKFWDVVIPSLQHSWILSIAKLIDPAYFNKDKNKPNMSIYYIIELLEDEILKKEIEKKLYDQKEYFKSIKDQRDKFLAHNDVNFFNKEIKAGTDIFFKSIDEIINEIKKTKPNLADSNRCRNINFDYTKKLSKIGVEEIFKKLNLND